MPFRQPPVSPLPDNLDLSGQTVVVTGATSGIGLEICRQLLPRHVATLVMAVRNSAKGEEVKAKLVAEHNTQQNRSVATIEVMTLDTSSYKSVKQFAKDFSARHTRLDILMLNAGISTFKREATADGHESMLQVNYLSNVLLLFDLLPVLEATAAATHRPSRVSITGSRMHTNFGMAKSGFPVTEHVLDYLDEPKTFDSLPQYANSKLLVTLFLREVADRYASDKVIVNSFCPGMVSTSMGDTLPIYVRVPVNIVKAMRARSAETAAWIALHAACVSSEETHGRLLGDKELYTDAYIGSDKSNAMQKSLWRATMEEMGRMTSLPEWA